MVSHTFVYKTTIEYSVAAETLSGRYYWTNCYFYESDYSNPASDGNTNIIISATQAAVCEAVTVERRRYERVYGPGTLLYDVYPGPNGSRPGMDRNLLHNSVYIWSGSKNTGWWYKRLRCVLGASEVAGGMLPSATIAYFQAAYVDLLAEVPLVNYRLEPVGPMSISPKVHHWQWRNGTKRRARNVLGPYID